MPRLAFARPLSALLFGLFLLIGVVALPAAAQNRVLPGHLPAILARCRQVGRVNASQTIRLALSLPLRNQAQLDTLLQRVYDPNDPLYGQYMTSQQFTDAFGPTKEDYQAVIAFAVTHGLKVMHKYEGRMLLDVEASAGVVEKTFGVRLMLYKKPSGKIFRAPDGEPQLPAAIAHRISGVLGLDTAAEYRPKHSAPKLLTSLVPGIGTGPNGGLSPRDIRIAYNLNDPSLTGAGQTLASVQFGGYAPSDIAKYEMQFYFPFPMTPVQYKLVGLSSPLGSNDETTLDIEMQIALAPGASQILVYEATYDSDNSLAMETAQIITQITDDNQANEISDSWGAPEDQIDMVNASAENAALQKMAMLRQSFFFASGDRGAYDDPDNPSFLVVDDTASPWVTSVGGTTLTTNAPVGLYASETTWSGSGGGSSSFWPLPSYQEGFIGSIPDARNVPDVCLNSDPNTGYAIYFNGGWVGEGGTSCAAPLWAAFTAEVNQKRVSVGAGLLGFANPSLYNIYAGGAGPNYDYDFHDIQSGKNGYYPAVPGYDLATGLGSFNGINLLYDLIDPDRTVWAWGDAVAPPGAISGLSDVVSIAGYDLALEFDGTVWAYGTFWTQSGIQGKVAGISGAVAISAGAFIDQGIFGLALKSDGTVWAWGDNTVGELGVGSVGGSSATAVQVRNPADPTGFLNNIVAISGGSGFNLALQSNGTVWAWGDNTSGELGNNSFAGVPVDIVGPDGNTYVCNATPAQVVSTSGIGITAIAAGGGGGSSLALDAVGHVWAWGGNLYGELGHVPCTDGDIVNDNGVPCGLTPVLVNNLNNVVAIAEGGGEGFSLALDRNGDVWAWGDNSYGELGNVTNIGTGNPNPIPTRMLSGVTAIAAFVRLGQALDNNGNVRAWGRNKNGELGHAPGVDGDSTDGEGDYWNPTPMLVNGLSGVVSMGPDSALVATGIPHQGVPPSPPGRSGPVRPLPPGTGQKSSVP